MSDFLEQLDALAHATKVPLVGGDRPWPVVATSSDFRAVQAFKHKVFVGRLPESLRARDFDELWGLHPDQFPTIVMYDKVTPLPRWQQAYGRDYVFSGQRNAALPVPEPLGPFVAWATGIHPRLITPLLNWYDPTLKHYIGKHSDSTVGLVPGSPVVTVSFGGVRVFRLRPRGGGAPLDLEVGHGDVVVIPWETNLNLTHEVPYFAKFTERRISITFRAFS